MRCLLCILVFIGFVILIIFSQNAFSSTAKSVFDAKKSYIIKEIGLNIPQKDTIVFTKVPRGIILSIAQSEFFDNDSCVIKPEGCLLLKEIAKLLENFDNNCTIEAHTEENTLKSGAVNEDWEISIIRANVISEYLLKNTDIDPTRIFPIGFGHIMPFFDNVSDKDFSNNRIDFVIFDYSASR